MLIGTHKTVHRNLTEIAYNKKQIVQITNEYVDFKGIVHIEIVSDRYWQILCMRASLWCEHINYLHN